MFCIRPSIDIIEPASATMEDEMIRAAYRLDWPVTVVVEQAHHHRLMQLPAGAVIYPVGGRPDRHRMIKGICNGDVVLMFARDLEDCAQQVAAEPALV